MNFIEQQDAEVWEAIHAEMARQQEGLEMIASENYNLTKADYEFHEKLQRGDPRFTLAFCQIVDNRYAWKFYRYVDPAPLRFLTGG